MREGERERVSLLRKRIACVNFTVSKNVTGPLQQLALHPNKGYGFVFPFSVTTMCYWNATYRVLTCPAITVTEFSSLAFGFEHRPP